MDVEGDFGETTDTSDQAGPSRTVRGAAPLLEAGSGTPQQYNGEHPGASVETAIVLELSVALLADPPTELTVIGVDNEEGIVTLSGEVGNQEVRRMAGEIARRHPGVASAINDLQVSPASLPHDRSVQGEKND
jgi:osmotically-inducible protein OsmY